MPHGPLRTVLDDLVFTEGPRWREGRLWCSDMHDHRVDLHRARRRRRHRRAGRRRRAVGPRLAARRPPARGGDGDAAAAAARARRRRSSVHADLSSAARGSLNDMIVAADGTAYIGDMGVRIHELGAERRRGADLPGRARRRVGVRRRRPAVAQRAHPHRRRPHADRGRERRGAADRVHGAVPTARSPTAAPTPSSRPTRDDVLFAPPDGICLDAEGAVWVADPARRAGVPRAARAARSPTPSTSHDLAGSRSRACSVVPTAARCSCASPPTGSARRSRARRTGRIVATDVDVPGAGRP